MHGRAGLSGCMAHMFSAVFNQRVLSGVMGLVLAALTLALPVAPARAEVAAETPAGELLKNGREALADRQPDEARQFFERILKVYPHTRAAAAAEQELQRLRDGISSDTGDDAFPDAAGDPGKSESGSSASKSSAEAVQQATLLRRGFVKDVGDRVFFAENSASIGGRARAVIEAEARWLKARPDVKIKIIGRADDGGSASDAHALSEKRAAAVRDKLIESGVPAERLAVEARGDLDPVATCRNALCQAQNRNAETLIAPLGQDFAVDGGTAGTGRVSNTAVVGQPPGGRALTR